MNELRKIFQRRVAPSNPEDETTQRFSSQLIQVFSSEHQQHKIGQKNSAALLVHLQEELADAKQQITQLQQTNLLLHKEVTAAIVQSHESEAALLLVNSQLEGFKLQCQEQAALIQAYQSSLMPSQQAADHSNNNICTELASKQMSLIVQFLEKDNIRMKKVEGDTKLRLEELTQGTVQLKAQVTSLTQEIETLKHLLTQQEEALAEKVTTIQQYTVNLRTSECLLAQAQCQLDAQKLHDLESSRLFSEERHNLRQTIDRLEIANRTLKAEVQHAQEIQPNVLELQATISDLRKMNEKLTKTKVLLKQKHSSTVQEITRLSHKLRRASQSPSAGQTSVAGLSVNTDLLVLIKHKAEKAYKTLVGNIERGTEDEVSFYSLSPLQFVGAEKQLNRIIALLSECIEFTLTQKSNTLPSKLNNGMFRNPEKIKCVVPSDSTRRKYSLLKASELRRILD